jgi:hypothetical protein
MAKSPTETRKDDLMNLIQSSKNFRALYEPRWYVNYNAYENNHFTVWLPESKQIRKIPIKGNKFFNQIPETHKQVDTIQNMLLSPEIIPVVYPALKLNPVSEYWAGKISDYLIFLYKHWLFQGVLHDAVHDALVMPVSYFQLLPPETNDGKMDILELDSFDVFIPPGIKDVQSPECRWLCKTQRVDVEAIHNNPVYNANKRDVVEQEMWSESEYKNILLTERWSMGQSANGKGTAIVDEMWILEDQGDGTDKVRVVTVCQNKTLRDEMTPYKKLPFVSLKLHQGLLYQPAFVEYILPMNRAIDLFQSRMEDAGLKNVRTALLAQYGSNIDHTSDENGETIYWKLSKPEYLPPPEIPPFFINYINMNFSWMERFGASAVTMGASPKGVKTYRTVEAIRQQDYASNKIPMDFMKIALKQLFSLVIDFASMYYLEPVGVKIYQRENYDVFNVLGEKGVKHNMDLFQAANHDMTKAPVVIHSDNVVDIEFETAQSYTMEGKRQTVFEAYKAGLIAKETALRMLKMGNVREILDDLEKEAQAEMQKDVQKQQMEQAAGVGAGAKKPETPPAGGAGTEPPTPGGAQAPKITALPSKLPAALGGAAGSPSAVTFPGIRVGQ